MERKKFIAKVAEKCDISQKETSRILEAMSEIVAEALETEGEVYLRKIGKISVKEVKGRTGINPRTLEKIEIPPYKKICFKPDAKIKEHI